jgi:hypothetical protein
MAEERLVMTAELRDKLSGGLSQLSRELRKVSQEINKDPRAASSSSRALPSLSTGVLRPSVNQL